MGLIDPPDGSLNFEWLGELSTKLKDVEDSQEKWDRYFIGMCFYLAVKSKDRSTRLGAVIVGPNNEVLSTGYNGFPRGVPDSVEEYHTRPTKYFVTEHAERNAIYNAARHGIKLDSSRLYVPFNPNASVCCDCARAIIQSGIVEIIGTDKDFTAKGKKMYDDPQISQEIMDAAGIKRRGILVGKELDFTLFGGV